MVASMLTFLALLVLHLLPLNLFAALAGGGGAVAAIGFLDDRRSLSAWLRIVVHFAAAFWAIGCLDSWSLPESFTASTSQALVRFLCQLLAIVWCLNLFNFMDGIDGIAASEAAVVGCSVVSLALATGIPLGNAPAAFACAMASGGFLLWNWPPARIFMGDVGSGYLGYVLAVLAVDGMPAASQVPWVWLILGGVFLVDASVTLARRILRGERVYEAHRSHAYQWLARRWHSHKRVTASVLAIDLLWLLPCAGFALAYPSLAIWTVIVALLPLVLVALAAGAGRIEIEVGLHVSSNASKD